MLIKAPLHRWPSFTILTCILSFLACAGPRTAARGPETREASSTASYLFSQLEALNNQPQEALVSLNRAIEQDPEDSYLLYRRAVLYASVGELQKAEVDCRKSLAVHADFDVTLLLGKILQAEERRAEAIPIYQKALGVKPDSSEAHYLLAETYLAEKNYPAVLRQIGQWRKSNPEEMTPLFYQASFYLNVQKSTPKAIATYQEILKVDSGNVRALTSLGELYLADKKDRQALETFHRIELLQPEDLSIPLKIALIEYESKRYDQAITKFKEVLQTHPDSDRVIYYLGVIYENVKRDDEALGEFAKVPEDSTYFRDAQLHQAYLHHRRKEEEVTVGLLQRAITRKPEIGAFYEYLAEIYRGQGQPEEGIHTLKEGISRSPEKESLYYSLGTFYDRAGRFDESMVAMHEVLKINPKNANALNYIGYSYADRGVNLDEALTLVQKALLLKPDDGYITDSLGWIYYRKGDVDQAYLYCSKAYQVVPQEPTIAEHLGEIFLKKDDREKALNYFRESLSALQKDEKEDHTKEIERVKGKIESIKQTAVTP